MRKIKLTKEERWIEDHLEEFIPANKDKYNEVVQALKAKKKGILGREKGKKNAKEGLIDMLRHRIRLLEGAKLHYEQNPMLMPNLKMANIEMIQNDIEALKEILDKISVALKIKT